MPTKSEMYEIVPVDPFSKVEKKSEELEKDIEEIKAALRGAVGLSKVTSNAEAFIGNMLELMKETQRLVSEIAESNKQLSQKMEDALEGMNSANKELSAKVEKILAFFEKATEVMDTESSESSDKQMQMLLGEIRNSLNYIAQQSKKNCTILESIEKNLKKESFRQMPVAAKPMKMPLPMPPMKAEEELPPPPVPP